MTGGRRRGVLRARKWSPAGTGCTGERISLTFNRSGGTWCSTSGRRRPVRRERGGGLHDDRSELQLDGWLLQVLITPEGQADPYPYYALMREEARVSRTSFGPYVVNGYDECQAVLRDPRLGRGITSKVPRRASSATRTRRGEFLEASQHNMLMADPPDPPGCAAWCRARSRRDKSSGSVRPCTRWWPTCSTPWPRRATSSSWPIRPAPAHGGHR